MKAKERNRPSAPGGLLGSLLILLAGAALAALSACGKSGTERYSAPAGDGRIDTVCTTGMIADTASIIGGERVRVTGLMGPGVDPHTYRMSRDDQRRLKEADLVLYHGLHLEGKMADFLKDLESRSGEERRMAVAVAEAIPEERLLRNELFGEYPDPHVWFDLELWELVAERITRALEERAPEHRDEFRERGEAYKGELRRLHAWALEESRKLPSERRKIVTSHDAYNYFARAYGFEVHGLQGISTETQAGLKDIQEAVEYVQRHQVPVIFTETSVSPTAIERVARSSGARISDRRLFSDALGRQGTLEGTFTGMFRYNLTTMVEELGES